MGSKMELKDNHLDVVHDGGEEIDYQVPLL